ncbi:TonB-dependent receptor [Flavivirga jejuensis]|uniref:Carboxypeptidase-like regulatory domain-containing protein n=1 Tax=Flavivirga jejuensis TaxID=870487 RepID=A0ABT8WTL9_9FLAO|nr:TonB-dependent receptor [Flavivirga jejuensis]MDO5976330.1 carboxypeptidase-like regulatory domain-containing protein [Flavivirga jejuensis]
MQYTKYLLLVSLCFWIITGHAQDNSGKISGTIKTQSGDPISFANISLKHTTYGAVADDDGQFIFSAPPGNYTLIASFMGYVSVEKEVVLKNGKTITHHFILKEASNDLDEVMIMSKSKSRQTKELPLSVNAIELKELSNTTLNLNEVLNKSTGVKVREQGGVGSDFEFSINGLSGKAVRFFIDGIPLDVMGSSMSLNNIPVNIAERVVVYKGVVPVHLGSDALGGAVNIITNKNVTNYLDASYSAGSFNTHKASITGQYINKKTGLLLKASGFVNYSDNDYTMYGVRAIKVIDEDNSEFVTGDFKRFHDQYKTALGQLELGLTNKPWADVFFIGGSYSETDKQIQTGTNQDVVYGGVVRNGNAYSGTLRYAKKDLLTKNFDVSLFASLSEDKYIVSDTLNRRYYWDGTYQERPSSEFGSNTSIFHINRPKKFVRTNLSYQMTPQHSFGINYTLDHIKNFNWDELNVDEDDAPGKLAKHNIGLSYQQAFLDKKLTNTFFVKYYGLQLDEPFAVGLGSQGERVTLSQWNDYIGYGIGSRYSFKENFGLKASYEKAYRLQEVGELFGNGYTVIANNELKPENSHNFNLGLFYGINWNSNSLFFETGGFLRDAENFIAPVVYLSNSQIIRYENTSKVLVKGLDAEVKFKHEDLLNIAVNATYQKTTDNTQFPFGSTTGTESPTYKNQLPNRPWLFGNATIGIGKSNVFNKKDNRLQLNWDFQYVHWYYLTWENYGNKDNINTIPDQYIQNASLSYSFKNGTYNIALEGRNITDRLAYDNFRLQKPGRAFSVKFRYFIK